MDDVDGKVMAMSDKMVKIPNAESMEGGTAVGMASMSNAGPVANGLDHDDHACPIPEAGAIDFIALAALAIPLLDKVIAISLTEDHKENTEIAPDTAYRRAFGQGGGQHGY